MKKGDNILQNTELITAANSFECADAKYKGRNILVLVAGPGSDGSYMTDTAKELSKYGNSHIIVQEIFRGRYQKPDKINPKEHLDDLIIETSKDLLNFEQKNNLRNIITVSHCLMGFISLHYGEISDNVEKSVLISTPMLPVNFSLKNTMKLFYLLLKNGFFKTINNPETSKKVMREFPLAAYDNYIYDKASKKDLQLFVDSLKEVNPYFIQTFVKNKVRPYPDLERLIPDVRKEKQDILYIEGEFENSIKNREYFILKEYLEKMDYREIRREIIPNAKHFCFMENPESFNTIIKKHLEKNDSQSC
jgi:pimeloyl-ACP methyl ester carboxylesterase